VWTIAQGGEDLALPPLPETNATLIEYQLASCLPVPSENTPIQSVLEFRAKHEKDLLRFRAAIETLREKVLKSSDPGRSLTTACEEVALAAAEVKSHMGTAGIRNALETLKAVLSVDQSALLGAFLGTLGASAIGSPVSLGAVLGLAANATLTLVQRIVVGGQQIPGELEGFAYVFRCEQKFGE
jgi:hypothetical protein